MVLSKVTPPIVLSASSVTVRGAVITLPNVAASFEPFGELGVQLEAVVHKPSASTFQLATTPESAMVRVTHPPDVPKVYCLPAAALAVERLPMPLPPIAAVRDQVVGAVGAPCILGALVEKAERAAIDHKAAACGDDDLVVRGSGVELECQA